ncbi:MAG: hypothetical protein ACLR17_08575 [Enterobacteriaceae bacterium]
MRRTPYRCDRDVPFSALFKYDGFDGGGDPSRLVEVDKNGDGFLDYDSPRFIKPFLWYVRLKKRRRCVMPVMVYTANASSGSARRSP